MLHNTHYIKGLLNLSQKSIIPNIHEFTAIFMDFILQQLGSNLESYRNMKSRLPSR